MQKNWIICYYQNTKFCNELAFTDKTDLIQIKNEVSPNIEIFQPDKRIPWSGHTGIHAISEIYKKLLELEKQ